MAITKGCKKLMAFVLSVALVLSVLFIPNTSAAKEGDPTVKVLGATLRLGDTDNSGKQSMRIGIQIDNANRASACAIQLTVGTKTHTVATKAGIGGDVVQSTLHSSDIDNNSVVYAVVLTNIPESAFYTTIGIVGKVWNLDGELCGTTDTVNKNVVGVVNTIQDKFPGLGICILDGTLYKDAGASKLTADDLSGYSNDPDPQMTSNPLATPAPTREPAGENEWAVPFERINENGEGEIFYAPEDPSHQSCARTYDKYADELLIKNETTDAYADGLVVNLPAEEIAKRYTRVTINYEYIGSGSGVFGFKYSNPAGSTAFANNDSFKLSRSATSKVIDFDGEYMPVSKFYMICFSTDIAIRIKSIIFSNPKPDCSGAVDLSTTTVNGAAIANSDLASYNAGVITVNDQTPSTEQNENPTTELIFNLPNNGTVDVDEQVAVVVTGSCSVPDFNGFRVRLADATGDGAGDWAAAYQPATSRQFSEVFTLTATSTAYKVALKSPAWNGPTIQDLTITGVSVYWLGRGAVAPTPMPSPSPTPVPTPVPTAVPNADFFAVQVPSGSSITVDGSVDAAWSNAIEYPFLYYSNGRVRNSSEATIKLLWDEDYIYGLYDVYDAYIDEGNGDEWNRDGIEIFFDEDNSKESAYGGSSDANTDAFQYRVSGLATDVTSPIKNGFSHNTSATSELYAGLTSRVKTASNGCGYRVEFAIPVAQKNNLGRVVGLDATVMDAYDGTRNNEMWFTSQKSGNMYSNASLFENVQLIAAKPATPVNSPDPADPAACLAHFTFDNSSRDGYVYKSTDGNAKATVIGSIDSTSAQAVNGESLYKAKGNPSYLKLENADGSSMLDGLDNVTVSYWSYVPDAYDDDAINYGWGFFAGRNGISLGTNNRYYFALIDRSDKYRLDMAVSDGSGNNVDNIAKTEGTWNNVTVVIRDNGDDSATSIIYVNGVQQATINGLTLSEALGTNSRFLIGIRPWAQGEGAEYFQGYIDDFAVFDRAFTASEVASYVGAVAVPTPAPTATPTPSPSPTPPVTDTELDPDNLVTNGNLANGTTGWSTNYNNGGISGQTVDYTHVLQVASRWNSFSGPKTTITGSFNVGDVLTYEYKVKRTMTLDNYTRYFVLKFKESGDEHESRPTSSSDGAGSAVGDADHWVTYYGTYTVQEATDSIDVIIMESGYVAYDDDHPSSNYTFYIDDLQIVRTVAATPAPTPGEDMSRSFDLTLHGGDTIVTDNADGSITINDPNTDSGASQIWFELPGEVVPNETVTIVIKGTSTGECEQFRSWLGNGPNSYTATVKSISTPSGSFSARVELKATQTATHLTFKSQAWNGPRIKGLTLTEATIYYTDRGAVVPDE